ncbi:ETS-related transcription factor Elf-2 [Pteropus alecto]|uniref:ETS-related transcription factor Elf-2 n=1 Tax=Pteropus alecto TaxID=9402 RepID=L5L345_PTEAL|nr:ETS-related transcription factor Elf-2 [Pteropus alecto]
MSVAVLVMAGYYHAESEKVSEYPAVIVEPVPSARLEQGYAAQVLVYDDETYMMQDVAEEQEVETENVETVAADSTSSGDLLCGPME